MSYLVNDSIILQVTYTNALGLKVSNQQLALYQKNVLYPHISNFS